MRGSTSTRSGPFSSATASASRPAGARQGLEPCPSATRGMRDGGAGWSVDDEPAMGDGWLSWLRTAAHREQLPDDAQKVVLPDRFEERARAELVHSRARRRGSSKRSGSQPADDGAAAPPTGASRHSSPVPSGRWRWGSPDRRCGVLQVEQAAATLLGVGVVAGRLQHLAEALVHRDVVVDDSGDRVGHGGGHRSARHRARTPSGRGTGNMRGNAGRSRTRCSGVNGLCRIVTPALSEPCAVCGAGWRSQRMLDYADVGPFGDDALGEVRPAEHRHDDVTQEQVNLSGKGRRCSRACGTSRAPSTSVATRREHRAARAGGRPARPRRAGWFRCRRGARWRATRRPASMALGHRPRGSECENVVPLLRSVSTRNRSCRSASRCRRRSRARGRCP